MNNYTEEDLFRLNSITVETVQYLVFGKEVSSTGTPHLQGFVYFQSRKYMNQAIQIIGQAHFSVTRFAVASTSYCKKDGDFTEIGNAPTENKKRNDLEAFKNDVKEGELSMQYHREVHSAVVAKYPNFVRQYIQDKKKAPEVEAFPLLDWQNSLNETLNREPDRRKIIFVVDTVGNKGKTWFARYYNNLHDTAQIIPPGKKDAMALVLSDNSRVVFFDCPRSKQGEFIQYDFLEEVKNGYVFSTKYMSEIKQFKTPHVVVMMNEHPQMDKLSADRYEIIILD